MVRPLLRILAMAILLALTLAAVATALVRQPVLRRGERPAPEHADGLRLKAHVQYLTSASRPRDAEHDHNLRLVASYIGAQLGDAGGLVEEQDFRARGKSYRNVVARFGPDDLSKPVFVVGAHYDAFGALPGADDNASGVAGLLEIGRILGRHAPAVPVLLVAFANEEPPFFGSDQMGSAVHAASLQRSGRPVGGMICLEMIGYFGGEQRWNSWAFSAMYPKNGDFIAVGGGWQDRHLARQVKAALNDSAVRALSFTGPREMLDASDHRNYWAHGWPAIIVTDTAYVRNPNYHTARDTAETLDYAQMARVVDGVVTALLRLARTAAP